MDNLTKIQRFAEKIKHKWQQIEYRENIPFISTGLISGLVCCLYAIVFSKVEKFSQVFIIEQPNIFYAIAPIAMVLAFIVISVFAPGATGSGIPQIITFLETKASGYSTMFLGIRVIIAKLISSLLAIFGGAAIGREGPSLQISAALAHNIGKLSAKLGLKIKEEQLIIAGAASGLAAAFNTPIGGIVYAIEELTQDHIRSYKTVLLMSVMISGFTAQLLMGNYLYLGYPAVLSVMDLQTMLIVSFVSFMSGVAGAVFSKLLLRLINWRKKLSFKNQIISVFFVGLAIAATYYVFGERAVYSGKDSINFILFKKEFIGIGECVSRFVVPLLSSMTGIAGGIFAPSLSAGAVLGGFSADLIDPALRTILGLAGMIGFLTGVTHTPITSFVLVLEMTDRHSAVFPMMLAAVFSSLGSRTLGHSSFYEESARQFQAETLAAKEKSDSK